ncbi:hypothetical protein [Marinococcus luteus]|uniref:hypothetical protein n=1 Tax=Marinococcus luteus TaxID=1122204 RepID=UPI002ACD1674|nr:hypothetical protein [Marinococcus luteus]MDZ5781628.1 hypothetical protein [Marinococcus luteus]
MKTFEEVVRTLADIEMQSVAQTRSRHEFQNEREYYSHFLRNKDLSFYLETVEEMFPLEAKKYGAEEIVRGMAEYIEAGAMPAQEPLTE